MAKDSVIGLDLGTSAVKVLQRFADGSRRKAREKYTEPPPAGWKNAALRALSRLDLGRARGIGLTAQVGTYVVDSRQVIPWSSPAGGDEIEGILSLARGEEWEREIGMRHPRIVSYPLPRLSYIRRHFPEAREVCQPKDYLLRELTGEYRSDPWSWRGLAGPSGYSGPLLDRVGLSSALLPPLSPPETAVGVTRRQGDVPGGIPVFLGLNDFYASLLGMGMRPGLLFDITGTSEHMGAVEGIYTPEENMVSGPFLTGFARYGVTASAGASLSFASRLNAGVFRLKDQEAAQSLALTALRRRAPIFLPYLNGERAPIWNPDARGVFFGLSADCTALDLAYAAMEGVCFSLMAVYEALRCPGADALRVSGGAAGNPLLNLLKAELTGLPLERSQETDTSALGAVFTALAGLGEFESPCASAAAYAASEPCAEPTGALRSRLLERYSVYKGLYEPLKNSMKDWRNLTP